MRPLCGKTAIIEDIDSDGCVLLTDWEDCDELDTDWEFTLDMLENVIKSKQLRWVPRIGEVVYTTFSADCENCPYPDEEAHRHCQDCPPKVVKDIFSADYIEDWYKGRILQTKEEAEEALKGVTER